jgi:hypothetical protein
MAEEPRDGRSWSEKIASHCTWRISSPRGWAVPGMGWSFYDGTSITIRHYCRLRESRNMSTRMSTRHAWTRAPRRVGRTTKGGAVHLSSSQRLAG